MMLHTATLIGRDHENCPEHTRAKALRVLEDWLAEHVDSATLLTCDRRRYAADLRASLAPVSSSLDEAIAKADGPSP
jgi:hypothetical protein